MQLVRSNRPKNHRKLNRPLNVKRNTAGNFTPKRARYVKRHIEKLMRQFPGSTIDPFHVRGVWAS